MLDLWLNFDSYCFLPKPKPNKEKKKKNRINKIFKVSDIILDFRVKTVDKLTKILQNN